ncbi:cell wall metabolism sensor histidine kinase WalK [Paenibacillus sp. J2TS4]|uniref:sensor histidine kinase n=1 Tax=Paenibacillus sp. J2TS4 TaxID=2807194 RepID=UPI001B0ECA91|nr:HAMP domain-containing sensor histidine kinase [Paenibacillus sp. J2TS4]GIP35754.1 two-component sensor histidine kinase [Paenibacillus sp. J2TS4]
MRNKFIRTVRWKFIFVFILSVAFTALTLLLCYQLGLLLIYTPVVRWVVHEIGSIPVMAVSGGILFLFFFFLLSQKIIRYLEEITLGLQEIAKGNLSYEIVAKSSDELGTVAEAINSMTKQLKKSIEEERLAEKTKNELITGVSHDLRTPLTSILGYLELIENDRYKDEVEFRYYTNVAYEKALRLKKLIDDLFEYTSIHDKGPQLEPKKININGLLKQLAEEFNPLLTQEGMTYRLMASDAKLSIYADGNQVVRAFENLISNAIRYGKDGKVVDIRLSKEGGEAVIQIINYGKPIPEKDLPRIFERFYRAEKSRSSRSGGSGLGLAITKSIVELNGGQISVRSSREQTVFETRFPLIS